MTVEGKIEQGDIVATIHALLTGAKTSYAVLNDADALIIVPMLNECIQSMSIAANLTPDQTVKKYLTDQKDKLAKLNHRIQVQLVRNAEVKSKVALA